MGPVASVKLLIQFVAHVEEVVVICFGGFVNIRGGINVSPICG